MSTTYTRIEFHLDDDIIGVEWNNFPIPEKGTFISIRDIHEIDKSIKGYVDHVDWTIHKGTEYTGLIVVVNLRKSEEADKG